MIDNNEPIIGDTLTLNELDKILDKSKNSPDALIKKIIWNFSTRKDV